MIGTLRRTNWPTVVTKKGVLKFRRSRDPLGYEELSLGHDGERTEIEGLVVRGTKGQTVLFRIWTACLTPLDMRGFEPNGDAAQSEIQIADGTAILVCEQYTLPKLWISFAAHRAPRFDFDPDRVEDVFVQRLRKVRFEDLLRDSLQKCRVVPEGIQHVAVEFTGCSLRDELALRRVRIGLPRTKRLIRPH